MMNPAFYLPKGRQPLIKLAGITKTYHNAAGNFVALQDVDVTFYKGEFVGVIGKSGSGKSTLVNMITGIDRPTAGKVFVDGLDIHAMKESKQARWRGKNLGVVFQFFQLLPMLTLVENVLLPMDFCDMYAHDARFDRAMSLLEMVGLADDADKLPGTVSGGQQQSAAIARALANDPPIVIADEPTGNLDVKTASAVYDIFERLAGEGRTIIMITHDPEIEHRLSRKILLSDGALVDPILAYTFPWLPSEELSQLNPQVKRMSYSDSESLDVSRALANHLILLEDGEIQLSFGNYTGEGGHVTLRPGMFFAGCGVLRDDHFKDFRAKPATGGADVALLPWGNLCQALKGVPDGIEKIQRRLEQHMLGKPVDREEGLIE
jgi:putative ABC transport system ATP-binding protein